MALSTDVLTTYAKIDETKIDQLLQKEISANQKKIVVLDDDPTGVQTVHDISVYTDWTKDSIRQGFQEKNNLFYILTNSRGFTQDETTLAHNEIAANVDAVAKELGKEYIFISRSDSTLRGHYPLETEILRTNYEKNTGCIIDGEILCPFFKEGGRFTIDDVHYVRYGNELIPANETEFAKDKTFGYRAATMPEYVEEKTKGAYQPLLERAQMVRTHELHGGIIVVGSHTEKTTRQLEALKQLSDIRFVELDATKVTVAGGLEKEVERCLALEEAWIRDGKTVCCYTSRALVTADTGNKEDELRLSVRISDAVQSLVGGLSVIPKFVIAKGGITSSDVGTKALGVKRANVLGQIEPGIPVWQTGAESKFPGIPYVIFPGNVGEDTTLRYAVEKLI